MLGPRRRRFGPQGAGAKITFPPEMLYAPRFRPISEIDRRPGRGGINYARTGGALPELRPPIRTILNC